MRRVIAIVGICLGPGGCAVKQLDPARSLSGQTTMTGCLNPGSAPGQYVLTPRDGGEKTVVFGHPRLESHSANHAIRVVGMLNRDVAAPELKAIHIEHVAASCQVPF